MSDANDPHDAALTDSASSTDGGAGTTEAQASAMQAHAQRELDESRVTEIAEQVAEHKARRAEEQAYRRAQSKFDKDLRTLQDRFTRRERELLDALPQAGLDAGQVKAIQAQRSREDELEALRERAAVADGLEAVRLAQQYRDRFVAETCAEAGIDPQDPRLDLSDPDKFTKSLARALRQEAAGIPVSTGTDPAGAKRSTASDAGPHAQAASAPKPQRSAREDLDLLGGGGGAAGDLPDDPDELWKMSRKQVASLRGRT